MDVSLIVINYNTYQLTVDCVQSVIDNTSGVDYEIIVVDNASSEFDKEMFQKRFPSVKCIVSTRNLGFAGGNNLGIKHSSGKYILLLNSDAFFTSNACRTLFDYMERQPKAAVVSPRLVFPNGRHQSVCQRFPSIRFQLFEILRLQKIFSQQRGGKILLGAFFDHRTPVKPDWVWGTCFFFRRELLSQLPDNKLDETYFMYSEDMKWCLDFRKLGYEIHYYPDVEVVHIMGGSSAQKNELMTNNNEHFLRTNYPSFKVRLIRLLEKLLIKSQ